MNNPPDYISFEEKRRSEHIVKTINSMVSPTVEDAVELCDWTTAVPDKT